jgi:hypothetical protein
MESTLALISSAPEDQFWEEWNSRDRLDHVLASQTGTTLVRIEEDEELFPYIARRGHDSGL